METLRGFPYLPALWLRGASPGVANARPPRPRGATRAHSLGYATEEQRSGRRNRVDVDELCSATSFAGGLEPSQGSNRLAAEYARISEGGN
jgi:hypothetical protein